MARAEDLALAEGLRNTRSTLETWHAGRWSVLRDWTLGSLAVAVLLLGATYVVAKLTTPDLTGVYLAGVTSHADLEDVGYVLFRNSLVLALHAMACVAGFIAGSSLPLVAERYSGVWRWVHDKAGPLAILFVLAATIFSLTTQAYILGDLTASVAASVGLSPGVFLLALTPHALPELVALFLPLAAWTIASRREEWHHLLAATFVTVAIATPVLIASAFVEVYISPQIIQSLAS